MTDKTNIDISQIERNNEMNTTRREFLVMLGAATAIGSTRAFAFAGNTEFRELDTEKLYYFRYIKDGMINLSDRFRLGKEWSKILEDSLMQFDKNGCLEQVFEGSKAKHMRFVPDNVNGLNDDDPGKIDITEAWLREFWRRHMVCDLLQKQEGAR